VTFTTPGEMLGPMLAFALLHGLEASLLTPWIIGRRLSLSPVAVFLSVLFWGWLWGIAGALIAVPLVIALRVACRRTHGLRLLGRFLEGDRAAPPSLHALLRQGRAAPTARPADIA
jgi:predicted PurR-regulated permease PerM